MFIKVTVSKGTEAYVAVDKIVQVSHLRQDVSVIVLVDNSRLQVDESAESIMRRATDAAKGA